MNSEIILNNGLIKALEFEAELFAKLNMYTIHFSATGNPVFLNTDTELVLFRIVQEALNNIVKHAGASAIDINLHYNADLLTMEIKDNGRGFYTDKTLLGTGLQNIKKRAAILQGNLDINSIVNTGTQIKIEIPLYEKYKAL